MARMERSLAEINTTKETKESWEKAKKQWDHAWDDPSVATGVKHDEDKTPMDLLDPMALDGLARVLQFGARKYASHNWRGGISYSRLIAALLRHSFAILRGEYVDPESNLPHIDHVGCCWMFLSWHMKCRPDLDDLWKPQQKEVVNGD
jgi:hypothetical protein